jgi:hypothetical protein
LNEIATTAAVIKFTHEMARSISTGPINAALDFAVDVIETDFPPGPHTPWPTWPAVWLSPLVEFGRVAVIVLMMTVRRRAAQVLGRSHRDFKSACFLLAARAAQLGDDIGDDLGCVQSQLSEGCITNCLPLNSLHFRLQMVFHVQQLNYHPLDFWNRHGSKFFNELREVRGSFSRGRLRTGDIASFPSNGQICGDSLEPCDIKCHKMLLILDKISLFTNDNLIGYEEG